MASPTTHGKSYSGSEYECSGESRTWEKDGHPGAGGTDTWSVGLQEGRRETCVCTKVQLGGESTAA